MFLKWPVEATPLFMVERTPKVDDDDEYEEIEEEYEVEVDEHGNETIVEHYANGNGNHQDDDEEEEVEYEEVEEEEEEEEEETEYVEGEQEDDIEPILNYTRLGHGVTEILKKDAASCMAVHPKFIVLGTHWGSITIHDFEGDEIKRFDSHTATITEVAIDPSGDYIASCSEDGKVVINPFDKSGETLAFSYLRPITAIALDPEFSHKNTRQFVTGGKGGQLILNSKGWFRTKETILHQGEGPIYAIKWSGAFIAWANDAGVKIYDCSTNTRIAHIPRKEGSPRGELYRCCLCWEKADTLIIGWAKSVEVIQIIERIDTTTGNITKMAQITNQFATKYWISGIAPFGEDLVILGYKDGAVEGSSDNTSMASATPKMSSPNGNSTGAWNQGRVDQADKPSIYIVSRKTNCAITTDHLNVNGYEHYKAPDYRLDYNTAESIFYIVCPKDVVTAKPRNLEDHLKWLMDKNRYDEALDEVEKDMRTVKSLPAIRIKEIGERYMEYLLERKDINKAASLCPKICQRDQDLWEKWVFRFLKLGDLQPLCPYIPIGNPTLSAAIYEMFLNHFLQKDPNAFLKIVTEWPSNLYNIQAIITAVEDYLTIHKNETIMIAQAQLYTYDNQLDKTLDIFLKLKRGNVFELITQNDKLFDSIQNKVSLLIDYDKHEAIRLLVSNTDRIPIKVVVGQLGNKLEYVHLYLHTLFLKDARIGSEFHELQVTLYADYDKSLLLPFLRNSIHYNLDNAYKVCKQRELYAEMVYILSRMGSAKEALDLILDKLRNIKDAIEFVEQQKDNDLWTYFINKSITNPLYVSELLENIGSHIDPIKLIQQIPDSMVIQNLKDRLIKILSDYNLQMSLREGCKEILKSDCVYLAETHLDALKCGHSMEEYTKCATCSQSIITIKPDCAVILYFCNHTYHTKPTISNVIVKNSKKSLVIEGTGYGTQVSNLKVSVLYPSLDDSPGLLIQTLVVSAITDSTVNIDLGAAANAKTASLLAYSGSRCEFQIGYMDGPTVSDNFSFKVRPVITSVSAVPTTTAKKITIGGENLNAYSSKNQDLTGIISPQLQISACENVNNIVDSMICMVSASNSQGNSTYYLSLDGANSNQFYIPCINSIVASQDALKVIGFGFTLESSKFMINNVSTSILNITVAADGIQTVYIANDTLVADVATPVYATDGEYISNTQSVTRVTPPTPKPTDSPTPIPTVPSSSPTPSPSDETDTPAPTPSPTDEIPHPATTTVEKIGSQASKQGTLLISKPTISSVSVKNSKKSLVIEGTGYGTQVSNLKVSVLYPSLDDSPGLLIQTLVVAAITDSTVNIDLGAAANAKTASLLAYSGSRCEFQIGYMDGPSVSDNFSFKVRPVISSVSAVPTTTAKKITLRGDNLNAYNSKNQDCTGISSPQLQISACENVNNIVDSMICMVSASNSQGNSTYYLSLDGVNSNQFYIPCINSIVASQDALQILGFGFTLESSKFMINNVSTSILNITVAADGIQTVYIVNDTLVADVATPVYATDGEYISNTQSVTRVTPPTEYPETPEPTVSEDMNFSVPPEPEESASSPLLFYLCYLQILAIVIVL
eukprot:gene8140-9554_t